MKKRQRKKNFKTSCKKIGADPIFYTEKTRDMNLSPESGKPWQLTMDAKRNLIFKEDNKEIK